MTRSVVDRVQEAGEKWAEARAAERKAAAVCYVLIAEMVDAGYSEVGAAKVAGVDRMTVRRALGKR